MASRLMSMPEATLEEPKSANCRIPARPASSAASTKLVSFTRITGTPMARATPPPYLPAAYVQLPYWVRHITNARMIPMPTIQANGAAIGEPGMSAPRIFLTLPSSSMRSTGNPPRMMRFQLVTAKSMPSVTMNDGTPM